MANPKAKFNPFYFGDGETAWAYPARSGGSAYIVAHTSHGYAAVAKVRRAELELLVAHMQKCAKAARRKAVKRG